MILNNKKILTSLILITALFSAYYMINHKLTQQDPDVMNEKLLNQYSNELNQKLPLKMDKFFSLNNTKVGHLSPKIPTLDLFYILNVNKNDVKDFDIIAKHMTEYTCTNDFTKSLINQNAILRHQFVTLDKELMPMIGVSKVDCFLLEKNKQEKNS